jgi:hypothetical protein
MMTARKNMVVATGRRTEISDRNILGWDRFRKKIGDKREKSKKFLTKLFFFIFVPISPTLRFRSGELTFHVLRISIRSIK